MSAEIRGNAMAEEYRNTINLQVQRCVMLAGELAVEQLKNRELNARIEEWSKARKEITE